MELNLTKDARKLLGVAYNSYIEKKKAGVPRKNAKFISAEKTRKEFFPELSLRDYKVIAHELCGAIGSTYYSSGSFELSDAVISHMEKRYIDGIKDLVKFIVSLK